MTDQDKAREMLDDLLEIDDGLSSWAVNFIDDMDRKRHLDWTENQIEKIAELHNKHC